MDTEATEQHTNYGYFRRMYGSVEVIVERRHVPAKLLHIPCDVPYVRYELYSQPPSVFTGYSLSFEDVLREVADGSWRQFIFYGDSPTPLDVSI